jgi:hypothetical protein
MIKDCLATDQPFCLNTHTDTELLEGAIETAVLEYERIAGTRWYARGLGSAVYVMYNPVFFETENVWFDSFLFPFYYMDNHMGRIAMLRGWSDCLVPRDTSIPMTGYTEEPALIKHVSSHFLKDNPIFAAKNAVAFGPHGQTYVNIWGGLPGAETSMDPYARGTLKRDTF